jgi:Bacteriophage tail sheath protein
MPEYLAPGVYVEEVSFRSKSIEGVPTSTTGYAGMTKYGPVQYVDTVGPGPTTSEPRLITSFTDFERVYGGLGTLTVGPNPGSAVDRLTFLAHAARAFFMNGGQRLYVSRVFVPRGTDWGIASRPIPVGATTATWRARWPGAMGNVYVETRVVRSKNIAFKYNDARAAWGVQAQGVKAGAVVEVIFPVPVPPAVPPNENDPLDINNLRTIELDVNGKQLFMKGGLAVVPDPASIIQLVQLTVNVTVDPERTDSYPELGLDPAQIRYIGKILQKDNPADEDAVVWLDFDPNAIANDAAPMLAVALQGNANRWLAGGHDGDMPIPDDLLGDDANLDVASIKATGLCALGEIDDIAIVALPDGGTYDDPLTCSQAADRLIGHAQRFRYRIAVVDAPQASSMTEVRQFRGAFDSTYAALYHPWIEILDPLQRPAQGAPPQRILLPPSGFVTGIYARSDIQRGVFKAPANEVVLGLTKFEANINKGRQDVLNPEGINALRFFEGRGNRVWGARTMSSDPEWKYVNVRRLFIFLEHSIDKATQWAVFEPNNMALWANIRQMVEDFLLVQWQSGALIGAKPEEAYFVRCDRTTMTQNDLDNGRLICLIGVAPTKPAEYVIFRIGQWTADAKAA